MDWPPPFEVLRVEPVSTHSSLESFDEDEEDEEGKSADKFGVHPRALSYKHLLAHFPYQSATKCDIPAR